MATLTGIISRLNGSAGNLTFRRSGGKTIVSEKATEVANPRTHAQMSHRMKWPNIIQMYKGISPLLNKAFENKAAGLSDYNMFVKLNFANSEVYLTKSEVAEGACVAAPYQITQGSLPSIVTTGKAGVSQTDIVLGTDYQITADTTVADFSNHVVENNEGYDYGDQIAFIYAVQTEDALTGTPKCEFYGESVTLDKTSEVKMRAITTEKCFDCIASNLSCYMDGYDCVYAWVHSRKSGGKTLVSPQVLINFNETVYNKYTGEDAYQRAVETYGGENDNFLTPDEQTESGDTPTLTTKFTLTLKMNHDSSYGSLDPAVGEHKYAEGTVVTITATPASGKEFDGWNDGPRDNPRTVTITEDMTLQANFS